MLSHIEYYFNRHAMCGMRQVSSRQAASGVRPFVELQNGTLHYSLRYRWRFLTYVRFAAHLQGTISLFESFI